MERQSARESEKDPLHVIFNRGREEGERAVCQRSGAREMSTVNHGGLFHLIKSPHQISMPHLYFLLSHQPTASSRVASLLGGCR